MGQNHMIPQSVGSDSLENFDKYSELLNFQRYIRAFQCSLQFPQIFFQVLGQPFVSYNCDPSSRSYTGKWLLWDVFNQRTAGKAFPIEQLWVRLKIRPRIVPLYKHVLHVSLYRSCLFLCTCLSFGSVFHIWWKPCGLCVSDPGLLHLTWYLPIAFNCSE
jgi:hypothetical protein